MAGKRQPSLAYTRYKMGRPDWRVRLNHPWAQGLQFAFAANQHGGSVVFDLTKRRVGTLQGSTPSLGVLTSTDQYLVGNAADNFIDFPEADDTPFQSAISILWVGTLRSGGATGSQHFCGKHAGNGGSNNPFDYRTDANIGNLTLVREGGGLSISSGPAALADKRASYGVAAPIDNTNINFYVNGVKTAGSGGQRSNATGGTGANIRVGRRADGSIQLDGRVEYLYIWNRILPDAAWSALATDPGMLLRPSHQLMGWGPPPITVFRDANLPISFRGLSTVARDANLPISFIAPFRVSRDANLPIIFRGLSGLNRNAMIPLEFSGLLVRGALVPLEFIGAAGLRAAQLPISFLGRDPNTLLHIWRDLVKLNAPFLHAWNDRRQVILGATLTHQWNVKQQVAALLHRWNVTPDLLTPFGASSTTGDVLPSAAPNTGVSGITTTPPAPGDIQQPFGTATKTP